MATELTKPVALTPAQRRERNREEVRRSILEAARAVMREEGVAALNLNEVARRVGMKTPSLYEYFPGKAALYDALYLEGIRIYSRTVESRLAMKLGFWEQIELAIIDYMNFAYENPELQHLCFERPVPDFQPSEASMIESRNLLGKSYTSFQEAIAAGEIKTDLSSQQITDTFIALLHGLTSLHMANQPHLPPGQGRFGSLIPVVVGLLKTAWQPE